MGMRYEFTNWKVVGDAAGNAVGTVFFDIRDEAGVGELGTKREAKATFPVTLTAAQKTALKDDAETALLADYPGATPE